VNGTLESAELKMEKEYKFHQKTEIKVTRKNKINIEKNTSIEIKSQNKNSIGLVLNSGVLSVENDSDNEDKNIIYVSGLELHEIGTVYNVSYTNNLIELSVEEGEVLILSKVSNKNQLVKKGEIYFVDSLSHEILRKVENKIVDSNQIKPVIKGVVKTDRVKAFKKQVSKVSIDVYDDKINFITLKKEYLSVYDSKTMQIQKEISYNFEEVPKYVFSDFKHIIVLTEGEKIFIYFEEFKYWRTYRTGNVSAKNIFLYNDMVYIINAKGFLNVYDKDFKHTDMRKILNNSLIRGARLGNVLCLPEIPSKVVLFDLESMTTKKVLEIDGNFEYPCIKNGENIEVKTSEKKYLINNLGEIVN
jgi:hypothetical protein